MQIILRQAFPLGRFHATPWKIFPYDDPHGEWPPSPWRLLRAIIARSYQFEREKTHTVGEQRAALVTAFCQSDISWRLPEFTWRGPSLRQYQPVKFAFDNPNPKKLKLIPLDSSLRESLGGEYAVLEKTGTNRLAFEVFDSDKQTVGSFESEDEQLVKSFKDLRGKALQREKGSDKESDRLPLLRRYPPRARTYSTTKVQDNFWLTQRSDGGADVSSDLWWFLSGDGWTPENLDLLEACLLRMTYFGRAESITEIALLREGASAAVIPNCHLHEMRSSGMVPVLAPTANATLKQVESTTDDDSVAKATIPPGARWLYAERPQRPATRQIPTAILKRKPAQLVQFAIGTRVAPALRDVVRLTQRFRGRALRRFLDLASQGAYTDWRKAPTDLRERAKLLTGKDSLGHPLPEHLHSTFFVHAEDGRPARLCVWRKEPFDDLEQAAILAAAETPLPLAFKNDPWTATLIPLDSLVPPPPALPPIPHLSWRTMTPFVPPRHVFDNRGRTKTGDSVAEQVCRELENRGISSTGVTVEAESAGWVTIHHTGLETGRRTNADKLGYHVTLAFPTPTRGPWFLGNSCHFGLGVFVPTSG